MKYRKAALATLISVCGHLVIFDLLIWSHHHTLLGRDGAASSGNDSAGMPGMIPLDVVLLSPPANRAGSVENAARNAAEPEPAVTPVPQKSSVPVLPVDAEKEQADANSQPVVAPLSNSPLSAEAAAPAAGDPAGDQALLDQIARCLPANERPVLAANKLNISLDPQGELAAVPTLDIDLDRSSRDMVAEANMIVQATLQCGPYKMTDHMARTLTLVADFSAAHITP